MNVLGPPKVNASRAHLRKGCMNDEVFSWMDKGGKGALCGTGNGDLASESDSGF